MAKGDKFITSRRCDVQMRKSKEKCNTPFHTRWRCTEDCKNCICCLYKTDDGTEHHVNLIGAMPKEK